MKIVSLVSAAFPSPLVKIGVRAENILMQSVINKSKPGFLRVSESVFSWWFGRVGERHILEEPVTCISRVDDKTARG